MKKVDILEKRSNKCLFTMIIYEKKMIEPLLFQLKKNKQINVKEVNEND